MSPKIVIKLVESENKKVELDKKSKWLEKGFRISLGR